MINGSELCGGGFAGSAQHHVLAKGLGSQSTACLLMWPPS